MLQDFVTSGLDADATAALLTMAGFEVEGVEEVEGEAVLEIKVMSNRGDGLSALGLAREMLAKAPGAKATELYARMTGPVVQASQDVDFPVSIESTDCDRFGVGRFDLVGSGSTPEWIQKRLRQAGMRPISLTVDLSNYVMLELGQPTHAYDLDTLRYGRIVVRSAAAGEKLTTLDGVDRELAPGQLMICDGESPIGVAGVMGGLNTEVTPLTKRILLESAHFLNRSVRKTRKALGLNTEASYRFERSVDPAGIERSIERFAELLASVTGAATRIGGVSVFGTAPKAAEPIRLRSDRARALLGMPISDADQQRYLTALGFGVAGRADVFAIVAPTWRPDIVREEDLIEEVGRVHGFDLVPETLPKGSTVQGGVFGFEGRVDRFRESFVRAGFRQIVGHSLVDRSVLEAPGVELVGPRVAASPEQGTLRSSLWITLVDAARRNGFKDLAIFEVGRVFFKKSDLVESRRLGALCVGALAPAHRQSENWPRADFFSLKGVAEAALASLAIAFEAGPSQDSRLHPTRQAAIVVGGVEVGLIGQLHPDLSDRIDAPQDTILLELDLDRALSAETPPPAYHSISRNPSVRRDIAFLIEKSIPFSRVEGAIRAGAGESLEKLWLFDVYEGKGIPEGSHSLAVALQLRKFGENFTDEEANALREKVVASLESLGAVRR